MTRGAAFLTQTKRTRAGCSLSPLLRRARESPIILNKLDDDETEGVTSMATFADLGDDRLNGAAYRRVTMPDPSVSEEEAAKAS